LIIRTLYRKSGSVVKGLVKNSCSHDPAFWIDREARKHLIEVDVAEGIVNRWSKTGQLSHEIEWVDQAKLFPIVVEAGSAKVLGTDYNDDGLTPTSMMLQPRMA
jgi:hypothetical protein